MKKILRITGIIAGVILFVNCVGCSPEKGNTSNEVRETIEVETIEVETIEVENVVYWPD